MNDPANWARLAAVEICVTPVLDLAEAPRSSRTPAAPARPDLAATLAAFGTSRARVEAALA